MSSQKEFEAQLTLKDRLNFPYLLANQILTFQKSILNLDFSEREIREAITGFVYLIPKAWRDDIFDKDLKEAKIIKKIDKRPLVAGNIRMSVETCNMLGVKPFEDKEVVDYYKMFHACINLLQRRRYLSKINPVEEISHIELEKIGEAQGVEVRPHNVQNE